MVINKIKYFEEIYYDKYLNIILYISLEVFGDF